MKWLRPFERNVVVHASTFDRESFNESIHYAVMITHPLDAMRYVGNAYAFGSCLVRAESRSNSIVWRLAFVSVCRETVADIPSTCR